MKKILLSTTYFGPVQWYQKLYRAEEVFIERCESFQKQTYRNRCIIATTNGLQALTIPVERNQGDRSLDAERDQGPVPPIHSLRISDHGNWRHLHWNALKSAYGESPFFDYYQDDIRPFFEQRWDYLLDFNEAIRAKICELIDIQPKVDYNKEFTVHCLSSCVPAVASDKAGCTDDYTVGSEGLASKSTVNSKPSARPEGALSSERTVNNIKDYRMAIRPKNPEPDPDFMPKRYYQVYEQKHGFLPNLSILDLLFNMGPESIFYL